MPNLTNGYHMFTSTPIVSFSGATPKLASANEMFLSCSSLTTFSGDLSSLIYGVNMFKGCSKLSLESIEHIANTINNISVLDKNDDNDWKYITVGGAAPGITPYEQIVHSSNRGILHLANKNGAAQYTNGKTRLGYAVHKLQTKGWDVIIDDTSADSIITDGSCYYCSASIIEGSKWIPSCNGWYEELSGQICPLEKVITYNTNGSKTTYGMVKDNDSWLHGFQIDADKIVDGSCSFYSS